MGFSETRFDDEALAFHQKVREGFLEIASQEPNRVCKVNGEGHPEEVAQKVWAILSSKLKEAEYWQVPDVR
jgi:dTMP kinase